MKIRLGSLYSGIAGTAREVIIELDARDPRDWCAGIGTWFIEAPYQSPAWQHYLLSAIHLRPIEDVKPPTIRMTGATHEFLLVALAPDNHPTPLDPKSWVFLRPFNLEEQIIVANDARASAMLSLAAAELIAGRLWAEAPLSGQVEPWRSFLRTTSELYGGRPS